MTRKCRSGQAVRSRVKSRVLAGGVLVAMLAGAPLVLPAGEASAQATAQSTANQQFLLAYRLFNRGEDRLALEAFSEFVGGFQSDPKVGDAYYYLSLLERRRGNNAKALEHLAAAPEPTLVPTYAMQVLYAQVLLDVDDAEQANTAKAVEVLEKIDVTNLAPLPRASVLFLKGTAYRDMNNLSGAYAAMKDAAAQESSLRARATMEQGRLLAMQSKPTEAIDMLDACLAMEDASVAPDAARLAGDLSYEVGQYDKAVRYYERVIRNHQSSTHFAPAAIGLMWAQLAAGNYEGVQSANRQLRPILKDNDAFMADYVSASAYQAAEKHAEAVQKFEAVLRVPPLPGQPRDKATYKMALSQFELQRYDDLAATVAGFEKTYPDSPLVGDAQFLLAASEVKQGKTADATARLGVFIERGPQGPYFLDAIMQRARLYESTDNGAAAIEDYRRYVAEAEKLKRPMGSGDAAQAALRLIELLNASGKHDEALAAVAQLRGREKVDDLVMQEAMYRQARALIDKKEYDQAIASLTELDRQFRNHRFEAESQYYRGMLLMTLKRPDEAVDPLIAAARSENLPDPMRANAYRLSVAQLQDTRTGFAVDLLYELEKLVGRDALQPQELIWISRYLTSTGEARKSLAYLTNLLAPESSAPGVARAEAVLLAGLNMQSINERDQAIMFFMQVRAMSQGFEQDAQLQLARTYWRKGELPQAIEEYRGLISVERADIAAPAIFDSAQIYRELARQYDTVSIDPAAAEQSRREAIKLYKRLTVLWGKPSLSPLPELSYINHAELEVKLGEGNGEATYKELIERFPEGTYATYAQAMLDHLARKDGDALHKLKELRDRELEPTMTIRVRDAIKELEATP